jgi:ribosome-associated toxin RatA of RatAB toxin-antitoxin module
LRDGDEQAVEGTVRYTETTASPEVLFSIAADLAAYPEWVSGVRAVEVLAVDAAGRPSRARFEIDGFIRRISYELEYTYDPPRRLEWKAVPGADIKAMDGYYEFEPLESGGTQIVYALRVETAFVVPGFLRRQAEKEIVKRAVRGLKRYAEEVESGKSPAG